MQLKKLCIIIAMCSSVQSIQSDTCTDSCYSDYIIQWNKPNFDVCMRGCTPDFGEEGEDLRDEENNEELFIDFNEPRHSTKKTTDKSLNKKTHSFSKKKRFLQKAREYLDSEPHYTTNDDNVHTNKQKRQKKQHSKDRT